MLNTNFKASVTTPFLNLTILQITLNLSLHIALPHYTLLLIFPHFTNCRTFMYFFLESYKLRSILQHYTITVLHLVSARNHLTTVCKDL